MIEHGRNKMIFITSIEHILKVCKILEQKCSNPIMNVIATYKILVPFNR